MILDSLIIVLIILQSLILYRLLNSKFAVYGEKTDEVQIIIKHRKPRRCNVCRRELSEVTLVNGKWICMSALCRERAS